MLAFTEACRCMADENFRNPNKSCCYDSDDDDLPEMDADDELSSLTLETMNLASKTFNFKAFKY